MDIIPFSPPDITDAEIAEVVDTLNSGWITTGPKTKLFEKNLSQYCNTQRTACLNSATAALELTLRSLNIGSGDEVIVPAYTYTASASVVSHVGAKTIIVDTKKGSVEYDPEKLEKAVTNKTKAIIVVDIAGIICEYDYIFDISKRNKRDTPFGRIVVISDAAHALGAVKNGQKSGQQADFTIFSFHAVKNLTTAEGGAVTWKGFPEDKSDALYKQYQLLSLHGQSKDALAKTKLGSWEYDIVAPYYKCNMTDILASIGLSQLRRYDAMMERRHDIIKIYDKMCDELGIWHLKHSGENFISSGHLYFVRFSDKDSEYRNNFIRNMAEKSIGTNVHYKPLPMHTAYKNMGYDIKDYPNAYDMFKNEVTLPLHNVLTDANVEYICKEFRECL